MKFVLIIIFYMQLSIAFSKENKLFWNGHDWNNITKLADKDMNNVYRIKSAYLNGLLDGRLNYYLKVWVKDEFLADNVFGETVDYLSNRELIKNIDFFYQDRLNLYIPLPSAVIPLLPYTEAEPIERNITIQTLDRNAEPYPFNGDLKIDVRGVHMRRVHRDLKGLRGASGLASQPRT